jgi:HPr kinase/phosphorylase
LITAGFFNPVHPDTVMVLGDAGVHYLSTLKPAARRALPRALRKKGLAALILPRGVRADPRWRKAGVATWRTTRPAHEAVHALRGLLAETQARTGTLHGVLVAVHGVGVLVTGPAGAGKSALALDLVSRGHVLIADDAVDVRRIADGVLTGHCPALLRGYLETRGLGLLDVKALHGARAARASQRIELVAALAPGRASRAAERLAGRRGRRTILGVALPSISLPARLGHNLPALVEAACLDQRLRDEGDDAAAAFEQRQARALKRST